MNNIGNFYPMSEQEIYSVKTINFASETQKDNRETFRTRSTNVAYLVLKGEGKLHNSGKVQHLRAGDVFFTFSGTPFVIEGIFDFEYMYISFIGIRSNILLEEMRISPSNNHFTNCSELEGMWKRGITLANDVIRITAEGILLYTLSFIGNKTISSINNDEHKDVFVRMKKYIDDNINNAELTLAKIAEDLSYNDKYLSDIFKKNIGIGTNEYINRMRIKQACVMMEHGFTGIGDISYTCGYKDPLYFSKVFKKIMGYSPRTYIQSIRNNTRDEL